MVLAHLRSVLKYCALTALAVYGWLRIKFTSTPTLIILTYHRILPAQHSGRQCEQPGMITSPEALRRHIRLMKSLGAVPMHLDDWLAKRSNRDKLPKLVVALTFDDGWQDNYEYGFPILRSESVPATVFLVTGLLDTHQVFWPEQVVKLLTNTPIDTSLPEFQWLKPYLPPKSSPNSPLTLTEADSVIDRLKELDDKTILASLSSIPEFVGDQVSHGQPRYILNNTELEEMARSELVRFGAHTQHHFRLNRIELGSTLRDEIVGCLQDLGKFGGKAVPIFCYPNGDITPEGQHLVKSHYQAACTTKTGWNPSDRDAFDLHRFNLHDGNSNSARRLFATLGRGII